LSNIFGFRKKNFKPKTRRLKTPPKIFQHQLMEKALEAKKTVDISTEAAAWEVLVRRWCVHSGPFFSVRRVQI
jgi:hypothetical protein